VKTPLGIVDSRSLADYSMETILNLKAAHRKYPPWEKGGASIGARRSGTGVDVM
jgi:hypothetical protein